MKKIKKHCFYCNKIFNSYISNNRKYCSKLCWKKSIFGHPQTNTGKTWFKKGHKSGMTGRYHSDITKRKIGLAHKGIKLSKKWRKNISNGLKGFPHFKKHTMGRYKNSQGYILLYKPNHPHLTDNRGYVFEHRLIMEKHLGRYLKPEEVVHHINEIRDNNQIENLMLFKNIGYHWSYHRKIKKLIEKN